ncbi:MAG: ATP-dependent zinc metalloprotease FtsH [Candidatus Aminicenantes bacterium]
MEKKTRLNIYFVIIAIWGVLIIQYIISSTYQPLVIPYSEFQKALKDGRVGEITILSNTITGQIAIKNEKSGQIEEKKFKTVIVNPDMVKQLEQYNVTYSGEIENTFFRDLLSWVLPLAIFIGIWFFLIRRLGQQAQSQAMSIGRSRAKVYMVKDSKVTFNDVAGVDEAKEELKEVIDFLKKPDRFTRVGGRIPKGILLVGPPGTGKTLLAKAVAGEADVPFFWLSGSDFVEMFVGVGAARVRDLFNQAKEKAPCIIFVDELDALGKARGMGLTGGHDEREQTLNQLLAEMDGFDTKQGVMLVAATNRPEILDPALMRAGRFDRQVLVDKPDKRGREEILKIHVRKVRMADDVDLEKVAGMTPGFAGADLENVVNEAALLAARRDKDKVTMKEFQEGIERIVAGLEKKNRLINEKERKIVAFHEIGHAMVALVLPETEPVEKISIIPRGISALGYTLQMPTEDRYLMSKTELLNRIAVLLGGRASEEITFSEITTGASNDIGRATDIARHMVTQYGMNTKLGQIAYEKQKQSFLMPMQSMSEKDYSEQTAREIDCEIRKIVDQQYSRAKFILNHYQEAVAKAADVLLEKETIQGSELDEIRKKYPEPDLSSLKIEHECAQ